MGPARRAGGIVVGDDRVAVETAHGWPRWRGPPKSRSRQFPRQTRELIPVLDRLAAGPGDECAEDTNRRLLGEEPHRAVAESKVGAVGVEAKEEAAPFVAGVDAQ